MGCRYVLRATIAALLCAACGGDSDPVGSNGVDAASSPARSCDAEARFRLRFSATWSAATHPEDFPPAPHFSGLIGAVHDADTTIWAEGELASPGIEDMAETGAKGILSGEIDAAIMEGADAELLSGAGIPVSPGEVSVEIEATPTRRLLTVVSMIAPSPDWFVGINGRSLCEAGAWIDELEIELFAFDAGTDDGSSYTAANADTEPPAPIAQITGAPFAGERTPVPVGSFVIDRL